MPSSSSSSSSDDPDYHAAKLLRAHGAAPVDVRTRLCERNLAAAMISPVSPPPPSCAGRTSSTSASSKGMDPSVYDMMKTMLADKKAAAAVRGSASGKVKTEPGPSPLCGKKRSLDDEANIEEGLPPCSVPQTTTPGADGCSQMPTGDLGSPPHEFSRGRHSTSPADSVELAPTATGSPHESCCGAPSHHPHWSACSRRAGHPISSRRATSRFSGSRFANYASFSLDYTLELEKKVRDREAEIAALRKQLEETEWELATAEAEPESGQATAAAQQLLGSEERVLRRAEQALEGYRRWMDGHETRRVALRLADLDQCSIDFSGF